MHKQRGKTKFAQPQAFPNREPLSERSSRIIQGLPTNPELSKPVLVGLLSVNPGKELRDELAKQASLSGSIRSALIEIAHNDVVEDWVSASAAVVLGLAIHGHGMHAGSCKPAFERLLGSEDKGARLDASFALYLAGFTRFNGQSIQALAEMLDDEKNGWVAAELLSRELRHSKNLLVKHYVIADAVEKTFNLAIRADCPTDEALRQRLIGVMDKASC